MLRHAGRFSPVALGCYTVRCASGGSKKSLEQLTDQGHLGPGDTVLVRLDLNVPFSKTDPGIITDDTRLRAVVPTVQFLRARGVRTVIATHCGRPKGSPDPKFSVKPVVPRLSELVGTDVISTDDCIGADVKAAVQEMQDGQVLLMENVRFHAGETKNDPQFALALAEASGASIYVNDAFGTAHRAHASTAGVTEYMDHSVSGFLMAKELQYLEAAVAVPQRPLVAIIGGAKVSTKTPVIEALLDKCDTVILVGGMVGTFYKAMGYSPGGSIMEPDLVDFAKEMIDRAAEKGVNLYLPTDVVAAEEFTEDSAHKIVSADSIPDNWMALDMGPESLEYMEQQLAQAGTVVWNGPLGVFEFEAFAEGTNRIAKVLADITQDGKTTIVGGGDSVAAITQGGFAKMVSHVSTGGGASLELLEGKTLPGVAALDDM